MIKAIALVGPTASGKTALSLSLAEALCAEIISCDSMQIYKDMNIGTAKASEEERRRVPHHLIDFLPPSEAYSAERYRTDAARLIKDISERGRLPMLVGGTGLYLSTLTRADNSAVPESDTAYREKLLQQIKTPEDAHALWERLKKVDPESAEKTHENNVRRVIRALEIYEKTGKTKTYFDTLSKQNKEFDIKVAALDFHERENLYKRIDRRVDEMMSQGLLCEVKSLYESGRLPKNCTAAQAIGYKELIAHLEGNISLNEATELIKLSSRRYAKRQLTWFRHTECETLMLDTEDGRVKSFDEVYGELLKIFKNYKP